MKKKENNFTKQPEGGLIQSQEWADFCLTEGKKILKFQNNKNPFFGIINKLFLVGNYIYIPRFSFVKNSNFNQNKFKQEITEKITNSKSSWVRFDLMENEDLIFLKEIFGEKVKKAPHDMQPRESFIMDISLEEEYLLKQMKSKTRYNIKLAEKKGVKIFSNNNSEHLKDFFKLVNKTSERKKVNFHSFSHYEKMLKNLPKEHIRLYLAEFNGKIIASNLITFYNGVATYLHGGMDEEFRNVMAPFLLQWKCIQEAKKNGCQWYDFGGVYSNTKDEGKVGITRFKLGFSPTTKFFETAGSFDVIFSPLKYRIYKFLQEMKKFFSKIKLILLKF